MWDVVGEGMKIFYDDVNIFVVEIMEGVEFKNNIL